MVVTLFVFVEAVRMWMEWMADGAGKQLPTISHNLGGGGFSAPGLGNRGIPFSARK